MNQDLGRRLRSLRTERGLSLREFAHVLREVAGHRVSHESVRMYEEVSRVIPAGYLAAVCAACDVTADWLLLGRGADGEPAAPEGDAHRHDWAAFLGAHDTLVLDEADAPALAPIAAHGDAPVGLAAAAPRHLAWADAVLGPLPRALCVTDAKGVVFTARGQPARLVTHLELSPGADWSEAKRGPNPLGTALARGARVATLDAARAGPDPRPLCALAAAILVDDKPAGAVALFLTPQDHAPARLLVAAYLADGIARDLRRPGPPARTRAAS